MLILGFAMSAADWRDCGYVDRLTTSRRVLTVDPLARPLRPGPGRWRGAIGNHSRICSACRFEDRQYCSEINDPAAFAAIAGGSRAVETVTGWFLAHVEAARL